MSNNGFDESNSLDNVEFPSPRRKSLASVRAVQSYIHAHDGATKTEIIQALEPEENHRVGVGGAQALGKLNAVDGYREWWWRTIVEPGLRALPDIEAPTADDTPWLPRTTGRAQQPSERAEESPLGPQSTGHSFTESESSPTIQALLEDSYLFELTYNDDGADQQAYVAFDYQPNPTEHVAEDKSTVHFQSIAADSNRRVLYSDISGLNPVSIDELHGSSDPEELDPILTTIEMMDGEPLRLTLTELTDLVAASPANPVVAVELLVELLDDAAPAVQRETLSILTNIVDSNPEAVRPAIDPVLDRLSGETQRSLQNAALPVLAAFAEHDPEPLTKAVPRLATLLHDDEIDPTPIARILAVIAQSDPAALLSVVPKLERYLETEPRPAHAWVLMAVGHLSKSHPGIAKEAIPIAAELINTEDSVLRSNAAGVLADLADEYPTAVKPIAPRAIELLEDDDDHVRYNASSILARVAKAHPNAVEPATEQLLAVLADAMADTRLNACWALTRIDATAAVEKLTEVAATDPDEDVRGVAQMAVDTINE